jgi:hypothetical protein
MDVILQWDTATGQVRRSADSQRALCAPAERWCCGPTPTRTSSRVQPRRGSG